MSELVAGVFPPEWTLDDLAVLPDDGHRYEIIDGGLHVSSPPMSRQQVCASRLEHDLALAAPPGFEVLHGVGLDLGRSMFVPGIAVVTAESALKGVALFEPAEVRLVVEIVSPSSKSMARLLKPTRYAEAGIPSYWRVEGVSDGEPIIVVYELDGDHYRQAAVIHAGERITVGRPFRMTLDPARLLSHQR